MWIWSCGYEGKILKCFSCPPQKHSNPVRCAHLDFVKDNISNPDYPALLHMESFRNVVGPKSTYIRECLSHQQIPRIPSCKKYQIRNRLPPSSYLEQVEAADGKRWPVVSCGSTTCPKCGVALNLEVEYFIVETVPLISRTELNTFQVMHRNLSPIPPQLKCMQLYT